MSHVANPHSRQRGEIRPVVIPHNICDLYQHSDPGLLLTDQRTRTPDANGLFPIVLGMLGIGVMRSYDKTKGTVTNSIR